jgi:hypothetical protein
MRKRKIHLAQFTRKFARTQICTIAALFQFTCNLVPRACDPREGIEGSGIIRYRKPRILAKIELRITFQWPIRFLPETDYPRAFVSFPRIAGSGNEIGSHGIRLNPGELMRTHTRRTVRISRVHERMGPGRICVRARSKLVQSRVNVYMFTCDIHEQGIFKQNLQKFMVKIFKTHVVTSIKTNIKGTFTNIEIHVFTNNSERSQELYNFVSIIVLSPIAVVNYIKPC